MSERPKLDLDDDYDLNLDGFKPKRNLPPQKPDPIAIKKVAERSGFVSREAGKPPTVRKRRNRPKTPYQGSYTIKVQPLFKETLQEAADRLGVFDYSVFEMAVMALVKEQGFEDLEKRLRDLTNS